MTDRKHYAGDLRVGRYSCCYGLYLLTKCTASPSQLSSAQRRDVVDSLMYFRASRRIYLHAFIVMSDHWHVLLSLLPNSRSPAKESKSRSPLPKGDQDEGSLSGLVKSISRRASYPGRQRNEAIRWQKGFHDRMIRENDSIVDIIRYIEGNPVRKGLVDYAYQWEWSTANSDYVDKLDRWFLEEGRWAES